MNYIEEYYKGIEDNTYIVSKRVKKQYKKLVNDISNHNKYCFDADKAIRAITFIEKFCKHSKGEWARKSVVLELFQKAYISALFGFVDKDTSFRRYRESMLYMARKNGKSLLLSAIGTYMLVGDGEPGSEVYSVASKKDQAKIVFDETHNMIKQNKALSKHIRKRKSDLYCELTMSKMQPLGKNSDTLDGLNSHCVIIDELHSIKDRNLYEVMRQSMSARQQPLLLMITTAGTIRENIFDDMYKYACDVVDNVFIDDTFLPVLYELDDAKEWTEPKAWYKANPGLGVMKKIDDLSQKIERAKNNPVERTGVLCKDLNIRESNAKAWLSFTDINNTDTFDLEEFRGSYCIGSADLSITTDLSCASVLMMKPNSDIRYVHQMYWLPKDKFNDRVQLEKIPYDKWLDRGLLRLCEGNTINYNDITQWFLEMVNNYSITPLWVYYDSYSARYWVEEMKKYGFKMIRCIQGAKTLSLPMQQMGADLQAKKINYNNNPITKWCLTNTGVQMDRNGNIVPIKSQGAKQRIDGTASMLDSYVGLMEHLEEFKRAL